MDEEEKKKKSEGGPETPAVQFGFTLGGIFKGLGEFIEQVTKLAEETEKLEKAGVSIERKMTPRGMYGVSFRVSSKGPVVSRFGTIRPMVKPGVPEVREPLVDVFENEDEILVTAELPGVGEKDIKTAVEERTLKISAEAKDQKYSKEVELPDAVTGEPETTYKNGVLEVRFKKVKHAEK